MGLTKLVSKGRKATLSVLKFTCRTSPQSAEIVDWFYHVIFKVKLVLSLICCIISVVFHLPLKNIVTKHLFYKSIFPHWSVKRLKTDSLTDSSFPVTCPWEKSTFVIQTRCKSCTRSTLTRAHFRISTFTAIMWEIIWSNITTFYKIVFLN